MADAFDPPNFPVVVPVKINNPPYRSDFSYPRYRKTSPIDLTPGPFVDDAEAALNGVLVSETYSLVSGGWTRRQE